MRDSRRKSTHRHAYIEINYLLQRIGFYRRLVILTTNKKETKNSTWKCYPPE